MDYKAIEDLSLEEMEAAFFAKMTLDMVRHSQSMFPTVDDALAETVGLEMLTMEEAKATYARGQAIIERFTCHIGERSLFSYAPPVLEGETPPDAYFVTDSGYLGTNPAYRAISFRRRKPEPDEGERLSTPEEIRAMLEEMSADANIEAIEGGYDMFAGDTIACARGEKYQLSNNDATRTFDTADELKAAMAQIAPPSAWNAIQS